VDRQVQVAGGRAAEQAAGFAGPLPAPGRDHDAGAGGEAGARRALADPAGDQDAPARQARREGGAGHELAPQVARAAGSCLAAA